MSTERTASPGVAEMTHTALPRKSGELVFHDEWERRAFAMAVSLAEQGLFEWKEFQQQLIASVGEAEGDDPQHPTREELAQLEYVEACAHETMRLKPVAPLIGLQTLRETTIGDVRVPPGIMVFSLMRRDSVSDAFVPQAAEFQPERWLGQDGPRQAASAAKRISMPFGAGPRICPGRYLALLEMKMAMAMLLGHFDIAGVDTPYPGEAQERLSFTMAPLGLQLRLQNRRPA